MTLKTELLPHQVPAVEKLRQIKVGALYMEMGTGKTRTALQLIAERINADKVNKVLWLCPCSVIANLIADIKFHTEGDLDWLTVRGIESLSSSDRLYLQLLSLVQSKDVFLVVDESNLVKNHRAIRTQRITQIAKSCKYRIILNGTPISKNQADLFSQWYILDKRILGYESFWSFAANHLEYDDKGRVVRVLNVDYLTRKIAPYSYIVEKSECLDLPPKKYCTKYFKLKYIQILEYEEAKNKLLDNIDEFDSTTIYKLFTGLQQVTSGRMLKSINPLRSKPIFDKPLDNPRIQALLDCVCSGEKTIIWCKFQHEIDDVYRVLSDEYGSDSVSMFCGKLNLKKRIEQLEKFRTEADFFVAHKACGGYGLNLQFCSNMVYYSNDFNWATRAQSEDRIHRIGQTESVYITDICADSRVDERILKNLAKKENLSDSFKWQLTNKRDLSSWLDGKDDLYDTNRT